MSIEKALADATAAMIRLAEAQEKANTLAAGGKTTATTTTTGTKAADKKNETADKPGTGAAFEAMKAIAIQVKEKHGQPKVKEITKAVGKADSIAQVEPKLIPALHAALEASLTEADAAEDDDI